jgi:hypothetical protein
MNTAARVRDEKYAHPERFCADRACLWRVRHRDGRVTPCRKHPHLPLVPEPEACVDCGEPLNNADGSLCFRCRMERSGR